jgi:signal transduction histidine kinase
MNSPQQWSLRTRISVLCAATVILLGLIAAGAAVTAVNNRSQLDTIFNEVGPLRTNSDALLTAALNEESGIRGYAVNGTPADLAPYQSGLQQEQLLTGQIQSELDGRPQGLLGQLNVVRRQLNTWRTMVAGPVIARVDAGDRAGAQALINNAARAQFDRVRTAIKDLQASVLRIRNSAVLAVQHNSSWIERLLIAAGAVVLVAGALLAVLLHYLVGRPVNRLASEVRLVAGGDYNRVLDVSGPPEVANLGRDIDEMRRQIVTDLEEVRAARQTIEETFHQLEQQAAELSRSNRDLEQFAYVASHDLQEPLRKVASFCQLLQRRYAGQLDERADQYIEFAVDGAQRMQRLINDLLAFSRIGRLTSGFAEVDLNALVARCVNQQEESLTRTGAEVTWDQLPVVHGEELLLSALITNLISNSVKFRRPDEPPRVHLSAHQVGDRWEISCQDNGIGIEPEFADKVFVIFQRLHPKSAYPGTGIGLAIAKKIVEYHGGQIWLDDAPKSGTTIRFTLPLSAPKAPATSPTAVELSVDTPSELPPSAPSELPAGASAAAIPAVGAAPTDTPLADALPAAAPLPVPTGAPANESPASESTVSAATESTAGRGTAQ